MFVSAPKIASLAANEATINKHFAVNCKTPSQFLLSLSQFSISFVLLRINLNNWYQSHFSRVKKGCQSTVDQVQSKKIKALEEKVAEKSKIDQGCVRITPLNCPGDGFRKLSGVRQPQTSTLWFNESMNILEECQNMCA